MVCQPPATEWRRSLGTQRGHEWDLAPTQIPVVLRVEAQQRPPHPMAAHLAVELPGQRRWQMAPKQRLQERLGEELQEQPMCGKRPVMRLLFRGQLVRLWGDRG